MEIICSIPENEYSETNKLYAKPSYINSIKSEFEEISSDISVKETDIGMGASHAALLITLFLDWTIGEYVKRIINKTISSSISKIVKYIKTNSSTVYLDEIGTKLMAVDDVMSQEKVEYVEEMIGTNKFSVEMMHFSGKTDFSKHPANLYVHYFKVNKRYIHIYMIKSTGEIVGKHRLDTHDISAF